MPATAVKTPWPGTGSRWNSRETGAEPQIECQRERDRGHRHVVQEGDRVAVLAGKGQQGSAGHDGIWAPETGRTIARRSAARMRQSHGRSG